MGHEVSRVALQVKSLMSRGLRTVVIVKWGDCYDYGGVDHRQGRGCRECAGMQVTETTGCHQPPDCTSSDPWDKTTTVLIMIHSNITTQPPVIRKQKLIVHPDCTNSTCGGETIALKSIQIVPLWWKNLSPHGPTRPNQVQPHVLIDKFEQNPNTLSSILWKFQ